MHPTIVEACNFLNRDLSIKEDVQEIVGLFERHFEKDNVELIQVPVVASEVSFYRPETYTVERAIQVFKRQACKYCLIIKIPRTTVTNEVGTSVTIYNLFIRIKLSYEGTLVHWLSYKRNLFTENQLYSGYIHSHCQRFSNSSPEEWKTVCTGSGPINATMERLKAHSDTFFQDWMGFIAELDQITRVESLAGGPYIRMEDIQGVIKEVSTIETVRFAINKDLLKSYIRSDRLKLGFINGMFCLGCTFAEWLIDFTEYYKVWKETNKVSYVIPFEKVIIKNNAIWKNAITNSRNWRNCIGKPVITFKGTEYKIELVKEESDTQNRDLIRVNIGATILKAILNTLNLWYGKATTDDSGQEIAYPNVIYQ